MNFNELSKKQDNVLWYDVYPSLRNLKSEIISFLEEVLPAPLLNRADRDYDRDELIDNSRIDKRLQGLIRQLDTYASAESLILDFTLSSDALELCGTDYICKYIKKIDWGDILYNPKSSFWKRLRNPTSCIQLKHIIMNEAHAAFISKMKTLNLESRIEVIKVIEDHSMVQPFFTTDLLEEIVDFVPNTIRLNLENIDLFTLPSTVYRTLISLSDPSFVLDKLPEIFQENDNKYYRMVFFYLFEGREYLLEQVYNAIPLKAVIADLNKYFTDEANSIWDIPITLSSLPKIDSNFNDRSYEEEKNDLLIDYLINRLRNSEETVTIIKEFFNCNYETLKLLDEFLEDEEIEEIAGILAERIIKYTGIFEFMSGWESLDFVSFFYIEPSIELLKIFRDKLLSRMVESIDVETINLIFFFLKPFYDEFHHGCNTLTHEQQRSLRFVFLSIMNQDDIAHDRLNDLLTLRNISRSHESFHEIVPYWINWIIEKLVSIESIEKNQIDKLNLTPTNGTWNLNFNRVLHSPFSAYFKPFKSTLFEALKGISDYMDYNLLPCLIACLLVNDRSSFDEWFTGSIWPQSDSDIMRNLEAIILNQDKKQFEPLELLNKMDQIWKYGYLLPHNQNEIDSFLDEWGITWDNVKAYVFGRIRSWNDNYDKLKDWYYSFRSCFIIRDENTPYGLTEAGIALYTDLINSLSNGQDDQNDQRYLRIIRDESWILKEGLTKDSKDLLVSHCRTRINRQRNIFRGFESCQDLEMMMKVTEFCFCILDTLDDLAKSVKQRLNNFRFLEKNTVSSDLAPLSFSSEDPEHLLTASIHRGFQRNFEKAEGVHLRRELAGYFSDKLKLKSNKNMESNMQETVPPGFDGWDDNRKEPNPIWRRAYVHALGDLGIHSRGKGHTYYALLNQIAKSDISPEVREAAEKACIALNRERSGVATGSSKRRLLNAWWWIRQAHLLTLGGIYDQETAEDLRYNEVR